MEKSTAAQARGLKTRNHLLDCSRELFLENGYRQTTARMIANRADANLGLLHYYFNGKIEIGSLVYYDVRSRFDELVLKYETKFSEVDLFLFSSALELSLCLKYPNFGKFFVEITDEPQIHSRLVNFIIHTFETHARAAHDPDYARLAGLSISAMKPTIIRYALNNPGVITDDAYLRYYLVQQLHFLDMDPGLCVRYMERLANYHIALDEKMTPVFRPKQT